MGFEVNLYAQTDPFQPHHTITFMLTINLYIADNVSLILVHIITPTMTLPALTHDGGRASPSGVTLGLAAASRVLPFVLLAALAALAVHVIDGASPAFADRSWVDDDPVWSANITIPNNGGLRGCYLTGSQACSIHLSPHTFTHDGVTFQIDAFYYVPVSNRLYLQLNTTFPDLQRPVLVIGSERFAVSDATSGSDGIVWSGVNLDWSRGTFLQVSLVPTRPIMEADYGVEISGGDIDTAGVTKSMSISEDGSGTFQVRLTADRGTTTAVNFDTLVQNAPYGAPGHNWNDAAVTITPKTVTFTGGSTGNWSSFQTVTVTGVPDGDSTPEQLIILALPDPLISGAYINGFHVTVADPCAACPTEGEGAIPPGLATPESAQLPVITLAGSTYMTVQLNSVWTDPGYTATDSDGNDLAGSVTITGAVDTTQAGTYLLYYQVADSSGTPATPQIRTVNVVAPEPQQLTQEPQPEPQQEPKQEPKQESAQEPEPEPEQEPTQEPESNLPAIVQQYDTDGSGVIEQDEWQAAVDDYANYKLTTPEVQAIAAHRG